MNATEATLRSPRYSLALPYLQLLKHEVEEAATSQPAYRAPVTVALNVGHTSTSARYISLYTNVALGRTLGVVFNLFAKLCAAAQGTERTTLYDTMAEQVRNARKIIAEFCSSGIVDMEESMKAHVCSMEVCVEGLVAWVILIDFFLE
jgi:hypothetical protein